jgi:hypothetical protein
LLRREALGDGATDGATDGAAGYTVLRNRNDLNDLDEIKNYA